MRKLTVNQPPSYPLYLGWGLITQAAADASPGPKALLYDRAVEGYALELAEALQAPHRMGIEGGEGAKALECYSRVLSWLAQQGLPRDSTLYVVGGGTLTDLGGFVASSYLRGIAYVSFPTTTLAMVDASVGGKTGINLPEGKNLVGSFYPPKAVYLDLKSLYTLPPSLFREGLVEAFKHGIIAADEALMRLEPLHPGWPGLEEYLERAVLVKVRVVEADPYEKGERKKLNLGHTLGHALEAATHHSLSHGAAVAYGLLYAALLGKAHGGTDLTALVEGLLRWLQPPPLPSLSWDEVWPYMARDKKKLGSSLHWVIPLEPGHLVVQPVAEEMLRRVYGEFLERVAVVL